MKKLLLLLMCICVVCANSQDVIVKKDGSTIISKVQEISATDVKYKNFSNLSGPIYTISKVEIMAINYENGDKDTFVNKAGTITKEIGSSEFEINPNLYEDNLKLVQAFNQRELTYVGTKSDKYCDKLFGVLRIEEGSIIETPELRMDFEIRQINENQIWGDGLVVTLYNKTDRSIYVDLANCFLLENGNGHPYYIPKATSTGQSATTGVGVNLGAVTGALGVGGVLGTLAGGVNIGSSNTNLISTTTYSQRVVSIPPTASLSLEPQSIFYVQRLPKTALVDELRIVSYVLSSQCEFLLEKGIIKKKSNCYQMLKYIPQAKIKRGAIMDVPKKDNTSIAIHITYSFSENIASTQTMRSSFYLSQIVGDSSSKPDKYGYNTPDMIQSPKSLLCFRITQPGGILYK